METIQTEQELGFRPLIKKSNIPVVKQLYSGYEIEKKFILAKIETDYTKNQNSITRYNEVMERGTSILQGYIKDIQQAILMLNELGIEPNEFEPNTIRLRRLGNDWGEDIIYILTLKDRKEIKVRDSFLGKVTNKGAATIKRIKKVVI